MPSLGEALKGSWLDILALLPCFLAALLLYLFATPLLPHHLPLYADLYTSPWGVKYGKPFVTEYINSTVCAALSFGVPFMIISGVGLCRTRKFWVTYEAVIGLGYALSFATLFQSVIKWVIGGLRPHFLALCEPRIPSRSVGFDPKMWHRIEEACTGDPVRLREAQMSFPSGHACAAFAGFGYLSFYLASTLGIFEQRQVKGSGWRAVRYWKLMAFMAPLLAALLIAASKVRDGWHHPGDVVAGALIGSTFATMAFRTANLVRSGVGSPTTLELTIP